MKTSAVMTAEGTPRPAWWRAGVMRQSLLVASLLALAWGMFYYYHGVLLPIRNRKMQEVGALGGTHSDLYPRWCGAQELLWHHRNPYSAEVTEDIQRGFYGRPLNRSNDPANPDRERDPEGFAYPVYVVFLLAPFLGFSFHAVGMVFGWLLVVMTPVALWLWIHALNLRLTTSKIAITLAATMSSYPVIDGLHLQQPTMLVAALMAGSMAALVSGRFALAGVLLALAMVKPQLAILTVAFVLVWTLGDWRSRKWFAIAFGGVMVAFLIGSEAVLPSWFGLWRQAATAYVAHHKEPLLVVSFDPRTAVVMAAVAIGSLLGLFWHVRKELPGSGPFNFAWLAALSLSMLLLPNAGSSSYNEVMLVPVVLWMFTSGLRVARESVLAGVMWLLAVVLLAGQWLLALPVSLIVMKYHLSFERETTLFVAGPEFLVFFFPLFLGLFILSAAPRACRSV